MDEKPRPKRKKTGGKKKHNPPLKERTVMLTDDQMKVLRKWGRGCVSEGLRWLIGEAEKLVRKAEPPPPRNNG